MAAAERFLEELSRQLDMDEAKCGMLCERALGLISRRLSYSTSVRFILLLPYEFQAALIQLPPGPDRTLTAQMMVDEASDVLGIPAGGARSALREMWNVLNRFAEKRELQAVMDELPSEISELLEGQDSPVRRDFQLWVSR
jgi:uncharacterized protein (DUF2267 family)